METKTMSFRDTIILAMSEEMRRDENVLLMGEDVGVFGGDFGTSISMLEIVPQKPSTLKVRLIQVKQLMNAGIQSGNVIAT